MLKVKYSGVNDGKPYPVDMVAFKDGDSVSNLNVENGELKLNGEPVGGGSGGGDVVTAIIKSDDYDNFISGIATAAAMTARTYSCENMTFIEAVEAIINGKVLQCYFKFINDSKAVFMPFIPSFYIDSVYGAPRIKLTPVHAELWNGDSDTLIWYFDGHEDAIL